MRDPMTRQRSEWREKKARDVIGVQQGINVDPMRWFDRRVGDGVLLACVADEPRGWHMSISFRDHRGKWSRYPRWDEIAHARDELLPEELTFVMFLPHGTADDYISIHDTTFHLHEYPERT